MNERTYKCLGYNPSVIIDRTEEQAKNCTKYLPANSLCSEGGICTVMSGAYRERIQQKGLESI